MRLNRNVSARANCHRNMFEKVQFSMLLIHVAWTFMQMPTQFRHYVVLSGFDSLNESFSEMKNYLNIQTPRIKLEKTFSKRYCCKHRTMAFEGNGLSFICSDLSGRFFFLLRSKRNWKMEFEKDPFLTLWSGINWRRNYSNFTTLQRLDTIAR